MERLTYKRQSEEVKPMLMQQQGFICPACKVDLRRLKPRDVCLDHDHRTGVIRGVLCRGCNGAEGKVTNLATRFKKDLTQLQWLRNLVEYLEVHRAPQTEYIHSTHRTDKEKRALARKRQLRKAQEKK